MSKRLPKVLLIDVDGVMTTGQFLYSKEGKEYKIFGPHDNDGIKMLKNKLEIVFLTADKRGFTISERRIVHDMGQRLELVSEGQRLAFIEKNFGFEDSVYIGDGFYDAPILEKCLCGIAPADARIEARHAASYVTPSKAGEGAVLDACLFILRAFFGEGADDKSEI